MPKLVKEISSGTQFSRSSNEGQLADSQNRAYRIILDNPNETIDIQRECQVKIGDRHPYNQNLYCVSFDARFEGDSRMVIAVTFNYQTTAGSGGSGGQDPKSQSPDVRPANWTTSTSLVEVPKTVWAKRKGTQAQAFPPVPAQGDGWLGDEPAVNPAGDMYDGVTALEPVVTISITQFERNDPTRHLLYAGHVNSEVINLGSLSMTPGTVLFRGVSCQPAVESWGGLNYRGWNAVYEFAYRRNKTSVLLAAGGVFGGDPLGPADVDIGWDIAVPVTGFNCRAFAPAAPAANEDAFGQPLRHKNGKIEDDPLALPQGIAAGDRVRAMVKVFEYEDGGTSQAPSASPIALKLNGRPLKTHDANGNLINKPLVFAYRVQPVIDLTQTLGLRLF